MKLALCQETNKPTVSNNSAPHSWASGTKTNLPVSKQRLRHCASVSNLFSLPPQPPYQNWVQNPFFLSKYHLAS